MGVPADTLCEVAHETCWTLIRSAAEGRPEARDDFARRYRPVVRQYLSARWRGGPHFQAVEDATQEVFLRCYRTDGPLARVEPERGSSFQAYLFGICLRVARGVEERLAAERARGPSVPPALDELPCEDDALSVVFDRAFAQQLMKEARELMSRRARDDAEAVRRVELLRLRFEEGLPIRSIAAAWGVDAAELHRAYARARDEFRSALLDTAADHRPGSTPAEAEEDAKRLLGLL